MNVRVEWLPVGHITHGYRRVFAIFENQALRHVVNIVPMPYELVFHVREMAGSNEIPDPSLWWGLSIISAQIANGTLLAPENPETADDGYLQIRPPAPSETDMIPLPVYHTILQEGAYVFSL